MKISRSSGFTLIELVVVISILGILAAFAIPRFAALETDARTAATQGLAGSVRSASALAHGLFLARGGVTVSMEGNSIGITNGYPDAADIESTLNDITGFTTATLLTVTTFTKSGAGSPCEVTYTEAAVGSPPAIASSTGGC